MCPPEKVRTAQCPRDRRGEQPLLLRIRRGQRRGFGSAAGSAAASAAVSVPLSYLRLGSAAVSAAVFVRLSCLWQLAPGPLLCRALRGLQPGPPHRTHPLSPADKGEALPVRLNALAAPPLPLRGVRAVLAAWRVGKRGGAG